MKLDYLVSVYSATALIFLAAGMVAIESTAAGESAQDDWQAQAERALRLRKFDDAVNLATKAIEQKPETAEPYVIRASANAALKRLRQAITDLTKAIERDPRPTTYMFRGQVNSELDEHAAALADFDRALELDPKVRGALRHRGRELFKMGRIDQSVAAFDKFVELEPDHENDLWERGLSRYYLGQFALAKKSFEDYHKAGPEDIENGLWRLLSQAEIEGLPAAQEALFKYEPKRRPPFPLLHELYRGVLAPREVEAQAVQGATDESEKRTREFYLRLYLGMWFVVNKDRAAAVRQLEQAVALRSTDYMWYVARLQLQRLQSPNSPGQVFK